MTGVSTTVNVSANDNKGIVIGDNRGNVTSTHYHTHYHDQEGRSLASFHDKSHIEKAA
jgi:hypothetical protein